MSTASEQVPTTQLVTGSVGDRCPNCQAALAADQRYCLNCGERRGRARFTPETLVAQSTTAAAAPPAPPAYPRTRVSAATTLVAGVATLLLAMGVGVLIRTNSNNSPVRTPAAQVVTVNGGGGANTTAATTAPPAQRAASAKAGKKAKRTVVHVTAKTAKAATAAAAKVLGSSKNLSKNVQQSIGGSCSGGSGCENGKFTGNFFPSG